MIIMNSSKTEKCLGQMKLNKKKRIVDTSCKNVLSGLRMQLSGRELA
jgi:hypothetical protein